MAVYELTHIATWTNGSDSKSITQGATLTGQDSDLDLDPEQLRLSYLADLKEYHPQGEIKTEHFVIRYMPSK